MWASSEIYEKLPKRSPNRRKIAQSVHPASKATSQMDERIDIRVNHDGVGKADCFECVLILFVQYL
jgi:hypothetical protein